VTDTKKVDKKEDKKKKSLERRKGSPFFWYCF